MKHRKGTFFSTFFQRVGKKEEKDIKAGQALLNLG
jgi:hypothetical protein